MSAGSHAVPEDGPGPVPRAESLARITALTALLRERHVRPPDAFVWTHRDERRWWAFGPYGQYTVTTPRRFGWPVGDHPWEGAVKQGRDTLANEVFVKPTFVDGEGRIAPLDAGRASPADNHLLTDAMCHDIAERMQRFADEAEHPPVEDEPAG